MKYKFCIVVLLCFVFLMIGILKSEEQNIESLIEQLGGEDVSARLQAAEALGEIGVAAKDAVPTLIEVLRDEGYNYLFKSFQAAAARRKAAWALGQVFRKHQHHKVKPFLEKWA